MELKKLIEEIKKIDKRSLLLIKWFLVAGAAVVVISYIATFIFNEIETGRHLLIMSVTLIAEGIWGGVLIDCMKRRYQ